MRTKHRCINCGAKFKTIEELKRHQINNHKTGTGNKPQDEVMSKSVIKRLAVQNPHDEVIREAFEKEFPSSRIDGSKIKDGEIIYNDCYMQYKWMGFKSAESRISELEQCNKLLAEVNLNNAGKIAELESLLDKAVEGIKTLEEYEKEIGALHGVTGVPATVVLKSLTEIKEKRC